MRGNVWRGLLLGWLVLWSAAVPAADSAEFEMTIQGRIEVGPDGKVLDYRINGAKSKAVEALVAKAVSGWRFEPIVEDGRAVIAMTDMTIALTAVPQDDDYLLRVDKVWFGASRARKLGPPKYPGYLMDKGITGSVVLVLRLDETGKVEKVHVERVDLGSSATAKEAKAWGKRFADAAVEAAQDWAWEPFEFVDGKPVPTNVRLPVAFTFEGSPWTTHYRGESTPAPWLEVEQTPQLASQDPAPAGGAGSVNSRFRLVGKIEGQML